MKRKAGWYSVKRTESSEWERMRYTSYTLTSDAWGQGGYAWLMDGVLRGDNELFAIDESSYSDKL